MALRPASPGGRAADSCAARAIGRGLAVALAVLSLCVAARAGDSRLEKARRIRDEIIARKGGPAAAARRPDVKVDPFEEAVTAAQARLASIDSDIEAARKKSEDLAAPREKLVARGDELSATVAKMEAASAARVGSIYRGARLGAGAAGWNPEPARSARLSRYLASIVTVDQKNLAKVEVERGSVIASLDRSKTDDEEAAAQLRTLEADRVEAQAALDRANEEADSARAHPHDEVAAADEAPPGEDEEAAGDADAMRRLELATAKLREHQASMQGQQPAQSGPEGGGGAAPGFDWPGATAAPEATTPGATPAPAASATTPAAGASATAPPPGASAMSGTPPLASASPSSPAPGSGATASGSGATAPAAPAPAAGGTAETAQAEARPKGFLSRLFGGDASESDRFAAERGKLPAPVAGKVVASYGQQHKSGATYRGVILRARDGAAIDAVADGRVSFVGEVPGLGTTVIVSHGSRYHTVYGRLGTATVKEGDHVSGGTEVGELPADNADLHFELRDQGKPIDPMPWLSGGAH